MKKLILLAAAAALAGGAYTAQAAPVTYVPAMGGNVGYSYNGSADGIHNMEILAAVAESAANEGRKVTL